MLIKVEFTIPRWRVSQLGFSLGRHSLGGQIFSNQIFDDRRELAADDS